MTHRDPPCALWASATVTAVTRPALCGICALRGGEGLLEHISSSSEGCALDEQQQAREDVSDEPRQGSKSQAVGHESSLSASVSSKGMTTGTKASSSVPALSSTALGQ